MRQVRDSRLETREARKRLPINQHNEPLWKQIHPGLAIGYYKGTNGGTWYMRRRIEKDGKKIYEKSRLGIADDYADANGADVLSYSQTHRVVIEKSDQAVTLPQNYTVGDAAKDYLEWFKGHSKSYYVTEKTVKAHILSKFENRKLESLTSGEISKWHQELVTSRTTPEEDADAVRRYRSTANRVLTVFKALLSHAWKHEKAKDAPWKRVEPFKNVDEARKVFLSEEQCKRLINTSQGDFRTLIQAALYTGARYGELTILKVRDLSEGTLHLQDGKTGSRVIFLTDEGMKFFERLTVGKHPDDLILTNKGQPWGKSHHIRLMKAAVIAAELPADTVFYALRHSFISLALKNGMNMKVLADSVGTSVRMIEKHYAKFLNADRRAMLNQAMPSFGYQSDNVDLLRKTA